MPSFRGLLCVILLPFHTAVLGIVAIGVSLAAPGGDAILAVARVWCRIILGIADVKVHPVHPERSAGGPYIVMCNHQSLFDIPALVLSMRRPFRIVAKRELFHIPIFGWALRSAGFIGIDRSRRDRAIASLSRGMEQIRLGRSLVIFAEGTRSADGDLKRLKKGGFHLAQQSGVQILPITFSGSRAVLSKQGWIPRPGAIDVHVGLPLDPPDAGVSDAVVKAAAAAIRAGYTRRHALDLEDPEARVQDASAVKTPGVREPGEGGNTP